MNKKVDDVYLIISKQEYDLIEAMRSVVSQTNKYEVHVITENYPGRHIVTEYYDTFLVNDQLVNYNIDVDILNEIGYIITPHYVYFVNGLTNETYQVIGDN